jgi:tetratricopeptide (TPR) repeat protein
MSRAGTGVALLSRSPQAIPAQAIEVDAGVGLPVAFAGLRKILQMLREHSPASVKRTAEKHPSVWNRLFPGEFAGARDLSELALTPLERRLHRESEQTYWILNLAARIILDATEESGRPLVLRNAGQCDLVSLRGVMRAMEWARIDGRPVPVQLFDWESRRKHAAALFAGRHDAYLATLRERMRVPNEGIGGWRIESRSVEAPVDLEGRYLQEAVDEHLSAERRIAAAILAMRACFFTTNYEGAMLAGEHGLALLEQVGSALDAAAVEKAWDELDTTGPMPAIELDKSHLGNTDELRALFLREIGVVQVFTGMHDESLASFARGLECKLPGERYTHLHMFRALTMIKRLGNTDKAIAEMELGLKALQGAPEPQRALQEGWLRNVYALAHFQVKRFDQALNQEKLAMKCVGELHDASATQLKINLISNLSVIQETRGQFAEAITTWRRYEKISDGWGVNFFKHHSYRLAFLQLQAGDRASAIQNLARSYASAGELNDPFHLQVAAADLGRVHLDAGERAEAETWFRRAVESARAVGEPLKLAESLAGVAVATGSTDLAEAKRMAGESTTYMPEAARLSKALATGDLTAVQAVLPGPRNKLNRPFDLVNL